MAAPNSVGERLAASRGKFLAFVRARVADEQLAQDVLQDGLLKALRAAPSLQDTAALSPWFYRILQTAIRSSQQLLFGFLGQTGLSF